MVNAGYNKDGSICAGLGLFGREAHTSIGLGDFFHGEGFGLIKISIGASITNEKGTKKRGDIQVQSGLGNISVFLQEIATALKQSIFPLH